MVSGAHWAALGSLSPASVHQAATFPESSGVQVVKSATREQGCPWPCGPLQQTLRGGCQEEEGSLVDSKGPVCSSDYPLCVNPIGMKIVRLSPV
jgi:hypothetical protein